MKTKLPKLEKKMFFWLLSLICVDCKDFTVVSTHCAAWLTFVKYCLTLMALIYIVDMVSMLPMSLHHCLTNNQVILKSPSEWSFELSV